MVHFTSQNYNRITVVSNWTLCCDLESIIGLWKPSDFHARAFLLCVLRDLCWPLPAWLRLHEGCETVHPFMDFTWEGFRLGEPRLKISGGKRLAVLGFSVMKYLPPNQSSISSISLKSFKIWVLTHACNCGTGKTETGRSSR